MSTRSQVCIFVIDENGYLQKIITSYIHHDGYLEGVGVELIDTYNTAEKARNLVKLGYQTSIGEPNNAEDEEEVTWDEFPSFIYTSNAEYVYCWLSNKEKWYIFKPNPSYDSNRFNFDYPTTKEAMCEKSKLLIKEGGYILEPLEEAICKIASKPCLSISILNKESLINEVMRLRHMVERSRDVLLDIKERKERSSDEASVLKLGLWVLSDKRTEDSMLELGLISTDETKNPSDSLLEDMEDIYELRRYEEQELNDTTINLNTLIRAD